MSKLFNYYSFDECSDEQHLFERLDELVNQDKIEYNEQDKYLIKIKDIELDDNELEDLCNFLDENNVYPYLGYEEDDDIESDYNDYDDYDDDYNGKSKGYRPGYDDEDF
jgi:hypothetical protein